MTFDTELDSSAASRRPWLDVAPIARASGEIQLPGSKSISIRALLLAALATGTTRLRGVLDSDDTRVMLGALRELAVPWVREDATSLLVTGAAIFPSRRAEIFLGNSGLSARTLLAVLAFMHGHYTMRGVPRMHERPIGDLVDALVPLGAVVRFIDRNGYLPLEVLPAEQDVHGTVRVRGSASSQFLTGLLQAGPLLSRRQVLEIEVDGTLISRPYIDLTLGLMEQFGVVVQEDAATATPCFRVPMGATYRSPGDYKVEGDASSASYFLALGALTGGPLRVLGVGSASLQGDVRFADAIRQMGVDVTVAQHWIEVRSPGIASGFKLRAIDADFNHIPDAAMTIAVLALFADGPSVLRNIGSWRVKETDRIAAMACELSKLGAKVETTLDSIHIVPPKVLSGATIDTYDDHRMAMSLALAACGGVSVRINDPDCVAKTFPDYFERLNQLSN